MRSLIGLALMVWFMAASFAVPENRFNHKVRKRKCCNINARPLDDPQLLTHLREGAGCTVELFGGVRRRYLDADAGLSLRHHRIAETDHIDTALEQLIGHPTRQGRVAEHHRQDWVLSGLELEPGSLQRGAELASVSV